MTDSIALQGALTESQAAPAGAAFAKTWSDARLMAIRSLRLSLRTIDGLVVALALPVILMGLFVYLFGGAIRTGASYIDFVVPGVLVVCIGYSAVTTSISVAHDLNEGMVLVPRYPPMSAVMAGSGCVSTVGSTGPSSRPSAKTPTRVVAPKVLWLPRPQLRGSGPRN